MYNTTISTLGAAAILLAAAAVSEAAQIKVLVGGAMARPVKEVAAAYAAQTGNTVDVTRDTTGAITKRLHAGEKWDVVVLASDAADGLVKENILAGNGRVEICRCYVSLCVKAGAKAPDISTPEAFKATLLSAGTVSYADPAGGAPAGIFLEEVLKKLGILEEVKTKTVFVPQGADVAKAVAEGRAEIGMTFTPELKFNKDVTVIGRLPDGLQRPAFYAALVTTSTANGNEALALIKALEGPAGSKAIANVGLEPLARN